MDEAVIDIVHAHDGGCGFGGSDGCLIDMLGCFGEQGIAHLGVTAGDTAGNEQAIFLVGGQAVITGHGRQVQAHILGKIGNFGFEIGNRHRDHSSGLVG